MPSKLKCHLRFEEKLQSVQYRDPEPSRFAHNLLKQEMDLSRLSDSSASLGWPFRLIEDLRVIYIVTSSFGVLVALAHVIAVLVSHHHTA